MSPEQTPSPAQQEDATKNWPREIIRAIPEMSVHSVRQQEISLPGCITVQYNVGAKEVSGFTIYTDAGQIIFHTMSKKNVVTLVGQLAGLSGNTSANCSAEDPLPEVQYLRATLEFATSKSLQFISNCGSTPAEIATAYGESRLLNLDTATILQTMNLAEVEPHIFHVHMPTEFMLSATFLRFQEHFESPEFRNKIFSLGEYKDWYRKSMGAGEFNYYESWAGFNVPDYTFNAFTEGRFNPLAPQEQALLELVAKLPQPFYIIGTAGRDNGEYLRHEIAHGLFHVNPDYRKEVLAILKPLPTRPIKQHLKEIGYCNAVLTDEVHAYLGDSLDYLAENDIDPIPFKMAHKKLLDCYKRHTVNK